MNRPDRGNSFRADALRIKETAWPRIVGGVALFTVWAAVLSFIHWEERLPELNIDVGPYEAIGAVLGLLMVLRTNAGYDRWWEGRRLWGGIVNQSRNLAVAALAYGPDDPAWRERVVRGVIAFGHASRRSLRGERDLPEVAALLGPNAASEIASAQHMPTAVSRMLADDLRLGLSTFAFQQADAQRALLIDHIGGCERIDKTPLPRAYSVEIRRFISLFLLSLPFVLFGKVAKEKVLWLVPLIELLVAYPLLAVDKIGAELQRPFATGSLNHLPLDDITATIERNLLALLEPSDQPTRSDRPKPPAPFEDRT